MQLSLRLTAVAQFVTKGNRLADIGTDHGYVPIYLVKCGIIPSAIAMDINKGPLERAKEHIEEYGLTDKVKTRLSDGLKKLGEGEADTVLIAGMGGNLIVKILEEGREVLKSVKELVLSPHSEIDLVRQYLVENYYEIIHENMVFDGGKYYTIIKAVKTDTKTVYSKVEEQYGKYMIYGNHEVFTDYIDCEQKKLEELIKNLSNSDSKAAKERLPKLSEELELLCKVKEGNGVYGGNY